MLAAYIISMPLLGGFGGCAKTADGSAEKTTSSAIAVAAVPTSGPAIKALPAEEKAFYQQVGRDAWKYMAANYNKKTGLVRATPDWDNTTLWDIGAQLFAIHSALEMGIITRAEYDSNTKLTLNTLQRMPLYKNIAFNRIYSTLTGTANKESGGYSATDLGRLLLGLKLVADKDPKFAAQIKMIVARNNFKDIVKNGYLHGQSVAPSGKVFEFQEGRIGYEQYMAQGFHQWGANVDSALTYAQNAEPVKVLGVDLVADKRWSDRLVSEPFFLYGIELGLSGEMDVLARNMLKAQEARFTSTGIMTITSEDALGVAPHYFYYYCVFCNRKPFVIDLVTGNANLDEPRWVSTKGALGWHAIMPNEYTKKALDLVVSKARDSNGRWASGIFEKTGESSHAYDINTASILLEISAYQLRGRVPLMKQAAASGR